MERYKRQNCGVGQRGEWSMGIFYNNYQKLVSENEVELVKLSESDRDSLGRMMKYMRSFRLSRFDLEVIRKDLIGMAGEAQLEGSNLLDRIGMPEREFCDRLVENAAKRSPMERIIPVVRNVLAATFAFYTLEWLMEGMPADFGITYWVLAVAVFFTIGSLFDIFDIWMRGRSVYQDKWKRKLIGAFGIMVLMAINIVFNVYVCPGVNGYYPGMIPKSFLIMGEGRAIFAVLLILALAVFFWNNFFWDRCSQRYRWR